MIIDDGKKVPKQDLKKEVVSTQAPAVPAITNEAILQMFAQNAALLELMSKREARANEEAEKEFARKEARRKQYESNRSDDEKTTLLRQATCKHLKGGKTRKRNAAVDHNVYMHTFITGETYIKCQGCGMEWRPTDTSEHAVRNGKVYKNHTKIGWAHALDLCATSTNQSSRSEIPPSQFANVAKEVSMPDPTVVDIDMNPVGDAESLTV